MAGTQEVAAGEGTRTTSPVLFIKPLPEPRQLGYYKQLVQKLFLPNGNSEASEDPEEGLWIPGVSAQRKQNS